MNVFKCVVKVLALAGLVSLVGCANVGDIARNQLKVQSQMVSDGSGIIYGQMAAGNMEETKELCAAINNIDPKCGNDKYKLIVLMSGFGFTSGASAAFAWIPSNLDYHQCNRLGDADCSYGKAKLTEGNYAEFIEVASANEDGKCKWAGLPRIGGVVCQAYDWDYRKNLNDWDTTSGITSIKKK